MTRMNYTPGLARSYTDLRLNAESNPYEVQDYLASFRKAKSATVIQGSQTAKWSSLPLRKPVSYREPKRVPSIFGSYGNNDDQDAIQISLDVVPSSASAKSRDATKANNCIDLSLERPPVCKTKYFPYRRSGYLDHMIRQSRVNSARVLLCENPDIAGSLPSSRIKSAQPQSTAPARKTTMPVRAKTAELLREQPTRSNGKRKEMKLQRVEIKDSSLTSVKTKEYTTDMRNNYYVRRINHETPRERVKAVRFDGGFQEAIISPRHNHERLEPPNSAEEETAPVVQEVPRLRNDVIMERQPPMDTSVTKETNHIPLNIYRPVNGQGPVTIRRKKDVDDYDYKTDKVLSYYLQQERRPGMAKFDFTAQNKLNANQGNQSASRGKVRVRIPSNETLGQSENTVRLGGGFIRFHQRSVLHQRPLEDDTDEVFSDADDHDNDQIESGPQKPKKYIDQDREPPINPTNLCLLCNNNDNNWKMVDAILSQSSNQDLTLPSLNNAMKH